MAFPVTLNGRTYTLTDFEGTNYVDGLPDAFEDFVTHAGDIYNSTSTTSNSIGTGSKTFTVEANKPYQAGTPLRIADAAAPSTNFLDTVVTSYSGTTLVVNSIGFGGSGTKTSWTVNIGGAKTVDGTLGLSQGGTGATDAAGARTNIDVYSKSEADTRYLNISGDSADISFGANMSFGDNNKIIMGAGSDLQIYHDSSGPANFINDTGDGDLILRGSNQIRLQQADGDALATFNEDGSVQLYHDADLKLATTSTGIDVTGTVTADGLTVNKNINSTSIPTSRSDYQVSVEVDGAHTGDYVGGIAFGDQALSTAQAAILVADRGASGATGLSIATGNTSAITQRIRVDDIGDISFFEDTGTTAKLHWSASDERLGIGTTSPAAAIEIITGSDNNSNNGLVIKNPIGGTRFAAYTEENVGVHFQANEGGSARSFMFDVGASEAMRIDSSGHAIIPAGVTLGTSAGVYAAANTLDDYEEGTWTPTDNSGAGLSIVGNASSYTKIGRLCYIYAYISYPSTSDASTQSIGGLPFTAKGSQTYAELTVRAASDTVSQQNLTFQITTSDTVGSIHDGATAMQNSEFSLVPLLISGVYEVA